MSRLCEEVAAHSADAAIYFRLRSGYGPLPGASTFMDLDCRSRFGSLAMTRSAVLWTFAGGVNTMTSVGEPQASLLRQSGSKLPHSKERSLKNDGFGSMSNCFVHNSFWCIRVRKLAL